MRRFCITPGCDEETGAYSKTGRENPYWCPKCDEVRIKRITASLNKMVADMDERAALADEGRGER